MYGIMLSRAKKDLSVWNRTDIVGLAQMSIIGVSNPSFYDVFHFTESRIDRFDLTDLMVSRAKRRGSTGEQLRSSRRWGARDGRLMQMIICFVFKQLKRDLH